MSVLRSSVVCACVIATIVIILLRLFVIRTITTRNCKLIELSKILYAVSEVWGVDSVKLTVVSLTCWVWTGKLLFFFFCSDAAWYSGCVVYARDRGLAVHEYSYSAPTVLLNKCYGNIPLNRSVRRGCWAHSRKQLRRLQRRVRSVVHTVVHTEVFLTVHCSILSTQS